MDIYALTDNVILQQIGRRLKEERLSQNISQKALAEASGLAQSSISLIEKGKNGSTLSIVALLRSLNRLDILVTLFEEKPLSPVALSKMMKKEKQRKNAYNKSQSTNDSSDFNWDND